MYLTQQLQLPGYDISAEILNEDKINVIDGGEPKIQHMALWHRHPSVSGYNGFPKILHGAAMANI
jgi:hypothetical protein